MRFLISAFLLLGGIAAASNGRLGQFDNLQNVTSMGTLLAVPATGSQVVSNSATQTLTNKTIAAGSNTISGLTSSMVTGTTGTGNFVLAGAPTLTTPVLGVASATTINKVTLTAPASGSTLTVADGKTLTCSNTLTLAGTDSSTLNIGGGGTLGTAAYTAASAYEVPLTFSTGLTRLVNTITVNASQIITTLSNLTSNGPVITSGGTGALSVGTTTGSGAYVQATSPTLVTPALGVATATSVNGMASSCSATTCTLQITSGKSVAIGNSLQFSGTDGANINIGAGGTLATSAYTDATNASNISAGLLASARVSAGRTLNAQTGTTYTFALADGAQAGGHPLVTSSNASAQTFTVPTNASVAFPTSPADTIDVCQLGAGKLTIAAAGGVTIVSKASNLSASAQGVCLTLIKTATNTWLLIGDLGT